MKRLFVNFFHSNNEARNAEIKQVLLKNCLLDELDEIIILSEHNRPQWLPLNSKIEWVLLDPNENFSYGRPNFEVFFSHANSRLTSPYDFSIISNADIWFNETLSCLNDLSLENICFALSRHEDDGTNSRAGDNSQDTWIFQGPIRPLRSADFPMGLYCCDWRLAWELIHAGYRLLNPCDTIITWHLHITQFRNIPDCVPGPHLGHIYGQILDTCCVPPAQKHSKGIIAMSLWGESTRYCVGAIRNAEMIKQIYPNWQLRIYHDDTVPNDILAALSKLHVELVKKERNEGSSGMFWRFEVADDPAYEFWAVRDVDSRFSYRERCAVDDWILSGKEFHIMHDHPWHNKPIMGGAFGGTRGCVDMKNLMLNWHQRSNYGDDELFLAEVLYPKIKERACLHHWDKFANAPFPNPRENGQFVLQIIDQEECFVHEHRHYLLDKEAERLTIYSPAIDNLPDKKERSILRSLDYSHEWTTAVTHIEELYEKLKSYRGGRALELGSFKGHSTLAIAFAGLNLESWDVSNEHLEERDALLRDHGLQVDWRIGDSTTALSISMPANVIFHDAEHGNHIIPELVQFWIQILKPGGILIVHDVDQLDKIKLITQLKPASLHVTLDDRRREMGYFIKPKIGTL